jgi:hypothetical protein
MATRTERVVLELEDNFTSKMAKAAATTALFDKTLAELDGHSAKANRSTSDLGGDNGGIAKTGRSARQAETDLNKYTGRLNLLLTTAATLGPALIPITAGAIPAVAGLTAGFGAAAGAAGVMMLALDGVGDAVKAIDAYKLEPTTQNLQKMNDALDALGPSGEHFAKFIDDLEPQLHDLQDLARQGLLPGVEQGINELLPLLPQVQQVVAGISQEMGKLSKEAGHGIADDASFQRFFNYLETDAAPTMDAFAKATGHVASGLASLTVDMAPLTRDFTGGLEHAAESFDHWAAGLNQTQGFREFLAYVEEQGPKDVALLEALGEALLGILHAAAPVGSAVLPVLTALANLIGTIGKSPFGPILLGAFAVNRAIGLGALAVDKLAAAWAGVGLAAGNAARAEAAAAAVAGEAAAVGGAAGTGLVAGAASGGLLSRSRSLIGDVAGKAVPIGLATWGLQSGISKLTHAGIDTTQLSSSSQINKLAGNLDLTTSSRGWFGGLGGKILDAFPGKDAYQVARDNVGTADQTLAGMLDSGQGAQAVAIFNKITAAAQKQGVAVSTVAKQFPAYSAALKQAGGANKLLGSSESDATQRIHEMIAAAESQHQTMLANFDAVTQWGQAVQNAAKQAASGAKGFNQYTAAGVANRQAVSQMVAAWNQQPKSIRNNIGQYEAAKAKLVQFATQMGATKAQIAAFTKAMNQPRKFVLGFQDEQALSAIARIKAQLASIPKSIRTDYYVNQINAANKPKVLPGMGQSADGTTVPKTGLPYADRHLYLLADGEEVISNRYGQADRHRGLLKAINENRLADGGTVRGRVVGPGGDERDPKSKKKPLFTSEGPKYYKAALAHNRPFAKAPQDRDWPWQTGLTDAQERKFEHWVDAKRVPFDVSARHVDYDMRGYWKKTKGKGWHQGSHFPDTWKTPYDTTFSHESRYATKDNPFYWHGDKLIDERSGQVIFAANGGFISGPGGPRDDRIPAWLSNGEFVVNAATTARLRPFLEQENAKGYAGGGLVGPGGAFDYSIDTTTVSKSKASSSGSSSSKDAETAATKKLTKAQLEHAAAVAKATGELRHLKLDLSDLHDKQFKDLRSGLRDLVGKDLRLTGDSLKDLNKASKLLGTSFDATKSALDTAKSNRSSLESTVTSGLMPSLFSSAAPGNVWTSSSMSSNTPQSINAAIAKATAQAKEFGGLLKKAEDKGLSGAALQEVLAEGGLDGLRMFANAPASQVKQFQSGFTGLQTIVRSDASASGAAVYGKTIATLTREFKQLRGDVKAVEKAIKDKSKIDDASRAKHAKTAGRETKKALDHTAKTGRTR